MAKPILRKPLSFETQAKLAQMTEVSLPPPPGSKLQQTAQKTALMKKEEKEKSLENLKAAKAWLEETFPNIFNFMQPRPLKRGIDRDLRPLIPKHLSKNQVRNALRTYVQSEAYWHVILKEDWRYDLAGEKVEKVLETHKEHARKKLLLQKQREAE